jgi:uncharacterized protein (TIGR00299 family) protein
MTIQRQPNQTGASRTAWIDVTAGVAGDMLLGALIDAGASLDVVQQAVDAVLPGAAKLTVQPVKRAGLRASKLDVAVRPAPARTWTTIRESLQTATLNDCVRTAALAVFARLAEAEGRVHGIPADDVHFHEVGAVDSIADVVGCCAAIDDLRITRIVTSPLAVGSGVVRSEHGELPIPVPAVLELTRGWPIFGGGDGELATPTGAAIVTTLAASCERIPEMRSDAVGLGAGQRDPARRANVVRIVVGEQSAEDGETSAVVLEANIDDLDPRVWPAVLAALLDAGAADAWLTPILMKKGRPAHTLHVLAAPEAAPRLRAVMVSETTTFGVRQTEVYKHALSRLWVPVELAGGTVRIKVAHRDGIVVRATPEFDDAQAVATAGGIPLNDVLAEAAAEAWRRGLRRCNRLPD